MQKNGKVVRPSEMDAPTRRIYECMRTHGRPLPDYDEACTLLMSRVHMHFTDKVKTIELRDDFVGPETPVLVYAVICERWRSTGTIAVTFDIPGLEPELSDTSYRGGTLALTAKPTDVFFRGESTKASEVYMHYLGETENATLLLLPNLTPESIEKAIVRQTEQGVEYMVVDTETDFGLYLGYSKHKHHHHPEPGRQEKKYYYIPMHHGPFCGSVLKQTALTDIKSVLSPVFPTSMRGRATRLSGPDAFELEMNMIFVYSRPPPPPTSKDGAARR